MHTPDLKNLSLDELVDLARSRDLLEDWREEGGQVQLRVGIVQVTLQENNARAYLRGLIRGHELAESRSGTSE